MSVRSFKLVSGEEVVGEVIANKSGNQILSESTTYAGGITSYTVKRPHVLQFQQIGPGQVGLAFVPWALSNPSIDKIEIPASAVIVVFNPDPQVERQYLEQTSGIAIAPAGSSLGSSFVKG